MRKSTFILALLMLVIALTLSACGAAKTDTPAPEPTVAAEATTAPAATASLEMPAVDDTKDATCNEAEDTAQQPCPDARPYRFVVITHGSPDSKFWRVVKNGVDQAAKDMRVQVEYRSPETFDLNVMAGMVNDAIASKPDGYTLGQLHQETGLPRSTLHRLLQKLVDEGIVEKREGKVYRLRVPDNTVPKTGTVEESPGVSPSDLQK